MAVEPRLAPDIRDVLEYAPAWPFTLGYLYRSTGKTPLRSLLSGAAVDALDAVCWSSPAHRSAGCRTRSQPTRGVARSHARGEPGGHAQLLPAGDCWRYRGAADSALELNRFLLSDLAADSAEIELPGTLLQGAVQVDPSATLERSTIRGPVVIGPRARLLRRVGFGPYTSIGEGVCAEGAEVENSIVLEGARISHLDRRLESSVIGPGHDLP